VLYTKSSVKDILKFVLFLEVLHKVKIKKCALETHSKRYCVIPFSAMWLKKKA